MRILLLIALGWLLGRLWRRFQTWKNHRKLVAQLKALGVYGGTVDTGKAAKKPPLRRLRYSRRDYKVGRAYPPAKPAAS